jgi:DNA-binding GntR family transcriptional regulator
MDAGQELHAAAPRDVIAQVLRDDILLRRLRPGARLVEAELSARFGVSRVPVREALSQLQSEGFITHVRYRGATVSSTSARDVIELMQVRRGLEVLAAQLAADCRGGEVAEDFGRVVQLGRETGQTAGPGQRPPLVLEFHTLVATASGNKQLQGMLDQVLRRVSWVFDQHLESRHESSWSDHAAIAHAILGGSPVQAGYLMSEHVIKDEVLIISLVQS